VSCNSYPRTYPIFKVIGTTDPVSIIQTANTKAIEYLDLVINKLESTRRRILTKISAGQPIATAISPYAYITFHIQTRFGINPRVPTVWTGSGYESVSVIIKRYKAVKKCSKEDGFTIFVYRRDVNLTNMLSLTAPVILYILTV